MSAIINYEQFRYEPIRSQPHQPRRPRSIVLLIIARRRFNNFVGPRKPRTKTLRAVNAETVEHLTRSSRPLVAFPVADLQTPACGGRCQIADLSKSDTRLNHPQPRVCFDAAREFAMRMKHECRDKQPFHHSPCTVYTLNARLSFAFLSPSSLTNRRSNASEHPLRPLLLSIAILAPKYRDTCSKVSRHLRPSITIPRGGSKETSSTETSAVITHNSTERTSHRIHTGRVKPQSAANNRSPRLSAIEAVLTGGIHHLRRAYCPP